MKYYDILNIRVDANMEDIIKSYKELAIILNPYINYNNQILSEQFKIVNDAYSTLMDEKL